MNERERVRPGTTADTRRTGGAGEVAALFLRLGFTAFGGPAAHIAMMREEVVRRRNWMSDERFMDLIGVVNLIPGPNSTELAIYLGYLRAGWPGLIAAGACFIGPAMAIVLALAWIYVTFGSAPQAGWILYGIKPIVIAIIFQALWGLRRTVLRGPASIVIAAVVVALYLFGANTLVLLLGGGALIALERLAVRRRHPRDTPADATETAGPPALGGTLLPAAGTIATATVVPFSQATLFFTFLKIGAVLYGSGYVLLAFLRADFVRHLGWLTDRQLLDAVSIGQFTPGPVFTTATFVGYLVGGLPGALLATLAIFLPAFVFIPIIHRAATALRRSPVTAAILDGVNLAALALMAGVTFQLGQSALRDPVTWALALIALAVLLRVKLNSAWLIAAGGMVGLLARGV
ncbi:MAG TPA: chromate efflux transporter [Ktedonobacterales bacterium]|nr:chromate efflux transporter [Ktedonobacterales bacterium]